MPVQLAYSVRLNPQGTRGSAVAGPFSTNIFAVSVVMAAALLLAGTTRGQELDTRSLEAGYAQLVSFEAQPEIAAAHFSVDVGDPALDDPTIKTAKLPLYREFESGEQGRRWFVQATGSYLDMEERIKLELPSEVVERLDAKWRGYGALLEGGLIFSLSEHVELAPSVGLGVSRLESEMDFSSPALEEALAPELDGVLYNWDTMASIVRASLALRYDQKFSSWRVKSSAHLSGSYIDSFSESERFSGFTDEAGNVGLRMDASHPIGMKIRDYPVFLVGRLGFTQFIGANRAELGFENFGEAGLSLGVHKFTLGLLGIFGSDVSGWNLLFNYDY